MHLAGGMNKDDAQELVGRRPGSTVTRQHYNPRNCCVDTMGLLTQGIEERNFILKLVNESKDLPPLSTADERMLRQDAELIAATKANIEALNDVHALGLDFTTALQAKGPEVRRYLEILRKTNELKDAKRMALRQQRAKERDAAKKAAIHAKAASNIDGRDPQQGNEDDASSMRSSHVNPLRPANEPLTTYENATMSDKHCRAVFRTITNARASGLPFEVMNGSVVVKCPLDVNANAVDYRLSQKHLAPSKMPEGTKGSVFVEFPHESQHMSTPLHCQANATESVMAWLLSQWQMALMPLGTAAGSMEPSWGIVGDEEGDEWDISASLSPRYSGVALCANELRLPSVRVGPLRAIQRLARCAHWSPRADFIGSNSTSCLSAELERYKASAARWAKHQDTNGILSRTISMPKADAHLARLAIMSAYRSNGFWMHLDAATTAYGIECKEEGLLRRPSAGEHRRAEDGTVGD